MIIATSVFGTSIVSAIWTAMKATTQPSEEMTRAGLAAEHESVPGAGLASNAEA
jgi:hypothetical protein